MTILVRFFADLVKLVLDETWLVGAVHLDLWCSFPLIKYYYRLLHLAAAVSARQRQHSANNTSPKTNEPLLAARNPENSHMTA